MAPRSIALLTNPAAGRGRGAHARDVVHARLAAAGHDVRPMTGRDASESLDLARHAVADGADVLVAVGGDGLVNVAVQVLAGTDVTLGVVATGTGNDVARYLDLPRGDPLAAADRVVAALATDRTRRIDLARVGGRYYVTVLCAGFDAAVTERANTMTWPRGPMRYNLAILAELRDLAPIEYTLDLDGQARHLSAIVVSVGNGPSYGGGMRITEGAVLDDGLLDVVVIKPISLPDLARTYPRLFRGTHTTHSAYEHHRARVVTVAASGVVAYADGERFGPLPVTIECVPGALKLLT